MPILILLLLALFTEESHAVSWAPFAPDPSWQSPGCGLQKAFIGRNPWSPLYPEHQANYWTFGWSAKDLTKGAALKIQGVFPEVRYLSWTLYDGDTGNFVSYLNDRKLKAAGNDQGGNSYTLLVLPEGSEISEFENTLIVPRHIQKPVLVLRYYEESKAPNHYGNARLPSIQKVEISSQTVLSCPPPLGWVLPKGNLQNILKTLWQSEKMKSPSIHFYRVQGAGLYPNPDNAYISTRLFMGAYGDTAILRVKLPEQHDIGPEGFIRYQSFCMGNLLTTLTPAEGCVMDRALLRDEEGWTTIVVSDRADVRSAAQERGYAALPKGSRTPLVLMRQMLARTDFEGALARIPMTEGSGEVEGKAAELFIGDFAPQGFYCSAKSFLERGLACEGD